MATLHGIVRALDKELAVADFTDTSHNGLQVENSGRVTRICCGVDASLDFFETARRRGANLLICHHGLSWSDSLKRITDLNYRRVGFLIRNDMALYACHLPLDAHPAMGNNAQLFLALGLRRRKPFGLYAGRLIGFRGELPRPMAYSAFKRRVAAATRSPLRTMDFGKRTVRTVAIVSGGAAAEISEAAREGVDVYLTGESQLFAYNLAREYGIHAIFAGHYATEVFGVRALAGWLARRFRVPADFADMAVPF